MRQRALRGDRLRHERELRGLTQLDLADATGISLNQIGRYETGVSDPSPYQLKRLAKALQVTSDYLLGLVDQKHQHIAEPELTAEERRFLEALRAGNLRTLLRLIGQAIPDEERLPHQPD